MNITVRRNMTQNLIVMEADDSDRVDEFTVKMIMKNSIAGFLAPQTEEMNGKRRLVYDTGSARSMPGIFELKKMTFRDLERFITSLRECVRNLEEYLLDPYMIITDPEYIFRDENTGDYCFCLSFVPDSFSKGAPALADMMITRIDYDDQMLVHEAYRINMLLNEENINLERLILPVKEDSDPVREEYTACRAFEEENVKEFMPSSQRISIAEEKNLQKQKEEKRTVLRKLKEYVENLF